MMKARLILIIAFIGFVHYSQAQTSLTTFIFVRHAEKVNDGTKDPELSDDGKKRAVQLSKLLANQKLSAVYSTNFKRTRNTVDQTASEHGLSVTMYESLNQVQLKEIANQNKAGTVLICGHSNTTPAMVNALLGTQTLKQWEDPDYGNLIIVTVTSSGETSLTSLRY